ncbi:hypothetical protein G7Y89_g7092 [Cudoniella acicularis]|uniref:HD domain-containing protein n=1 Tax=Cudoniella acicularis TaxID=354080 RepID=A0A8H4RLT9_9HELO|nr:hypothetical protein G7Y89_g7092 [Cudoniella acicularis]
MVAPVPTRVLAGITVPDTPLITKALAFVHEHCDEFTYNHVIRSWLFGQYISDAIPELKTRDAELHAITAILHDLGWATSGDLVSKDKRFEVDGANAAREFLIREGKKEEWDDRRLQLAWDAIALHTTPSIGMHKETEVKCCGLGIATDFTGPERSFGGILTRNIWEGVVKEYPRLGFKKGILRILCGLCREKPETTYDSFLSDIGEKYVEGYSTEGPSFFGYY